MLARMSPVVMSLFGCSHQGSERKLHYVVLPRAGLGKFFQLSKASDLCQEPETLDSSEFARAGCLEVVSGIRKAVVYHLHLLQG